MFLSYRPISNRFSALEILNDKDNDDDDDDDDDVGIYGTSADCYRLIKIVGNESPY
jgi:hypothetical protein